MVQGVLAVGPPGTPCVNGQEQDALIAGILIASASIRVNQWCRTAGGIAPVQYCRYVLYLWELCIGKKFQADFKNSLKKSYILKYFIGIL
jgi:hypothetical protein